MIREEIILKRIENKDVLDIGSIGQTSEYSLWNLYKDVKLKSITGIDLFGAKQLAKKEFSIKNLELENEAQIVSGNMENYKFPQKFDIIIAGDVLEHVSNQGLFLDNVREHLKEDGELILTTPNAKWWTVFLKPNSTHTLWHDRFTLERILTLHRFKIKYLKYYYGNKKRYSLVKRVLLNRQAIILICTKSLA